MGRDEVVVVGGGVGGLTAAIDLARRGVNVTLLERASHLGGKLREVEVGGQRLDAGPTVLTMRSVFEELFADAGANLAEHVTLRPAALLARHAWAGSPGSLDLFADVDRSADAIGELCGAREAHGYRRFAEHTARLFETVEGPFLRSARPGVAAALGPGGPGLSGLLRLAPHRSLWSLLGDFFRDPRLLQLFGRYATYAGSSPFAAPATLAVIAHVEREGVWLVEGGMARLGDALVALARRLGVTFRTNAHVERITVRGGAVSGVQLADGEHLSARAVVWNGDASALRAGLAGDQVVRAAPRPLPRSLSALTTCFLARARGLPLVRHTVAFSRDYTAEFADLAIGELPREPTVYLCAQDRNGDGALAPRAEEGGERIFALVNAPAFGDERQLTTEEIERCERDTKRVLEAAGIELEQVTSPVVTTPSDFARRFPATGGALYGAATHGMTSVLTRPSARTKLPGLHLAGGSAHPGAGLPLVATSGRLAASSVLEDLASTRRWLRTAIAGGTSMP